jgi:hypothetical protein
VCVCVSYVPLSLDSAQEELEKKIIKTTEVKLKVLRDVLEAAVTEGTNSNMILCDYVTVKKKIDASK